MRTRLAGLLLAAATPFVLAGCGDAADSTTTATSSTPSSAPATSSPPPAATDSTSAPADTDSRTGSGVEQVVGAAIRFTGGGTSVDVTVDEDNPTVRDLLSQLPLTLTVEEFSGKEKISYLPRELATTGSSGTDPEDGDLIYFTPWGNLGFYYDASGVGFADNVIHIGTYQADEDTLSRLENTEVTVERTG